MTQGQVKIGPTINHAYPVLDTQEWGRGEGRGSPPDRNRERKGYWY